MGTASPAGGQAMNRQMYAAPADPARVAGKPAHGQTLKPLISGG